MSAYHRGDPDFETVRLDQFGDAYLNESSDQIWIDENPQVYQPQEVIQESAPLDVMGLVWRLTLIGGAWWLLADAIRKDGRKR